MGRESDGDARQTPINRISRSQQCSVCTVYDTHLRGTRYASRVSASYTCTHCPCYSLCEHCHSLYAHRHFSGAHRFRTLYVTTRTLSVTYPVNGTAQSQTRGANNCPAIKMGGGSVLYTGNRSRSPRGNRRASRATKQRDSASMERETDRTYLR